MRPPRPWPSWRRAMSRLRSSGDELEAGGQALDDARQAGAVRLAGGDQTELHGPKLICWRLSGRGVVRAAARARAANAGARRTRARPSARSSAGPGSRSARRGSSSSRPALDSPRRTLLTAGARVALLEAMLTTRSSSVTACPVGREVFELLRLPRLAGRSLRTAMALGRHVACAVQDRFADEREGRALAAGGHAAEDDQRLLAPRAAASAA